MSIDPGEVVLGSVHGLAVEVHNSTDRPLLFDGERAVATIGSAHYDCAPAAAIDAAACPRRTSKERFNSAFKATVAAAVTIGAVPTVHDAKVQIRPVLERYGGDETRREDELTRFGKRILWPGDSTRGVVFFAADSPLAGASLEMPVSSLFDSNDRASISTPR